jgi:hypothetical protein
MMMSDEDPKIWGASFWTVMRKIASKYPMSDPSPDVRASAQAFFLSLTDLLPCHKCREHYRELSQQYPVSAALDTRAALSRWVETIRGEVDRSLPTKPYPSAVQAPNHSAAAFRQIPNIRTLPSSRVPPPGRPVFNPRLQVQQQNASLASFTGGTPSIQTRRPIITLPSPAVALAVQRPRQAQIRPANQKTVQIQKKGCSACSGGNKANAAAKSIRT